MFDTNKRKIELDVTWNDMNELDTFEDYKDEIISQEKAMIEQAKKEAVKEFAEKLWKQGTPWEQQDRDNINKLLEEYGVTI
jgi:hypothetical protein